MEEIIYHHFLGIKMKKIIYNLFLGLIQAILLIMTFSLMTWPLICPDNYFLFIIFAFSVYLYVITVIKISRM